MQNEGEDCEGGQEAQPGFRGFHDRAAGRVGGGTSEPPRAMWLKLKQSFLFLLDRNCLRKSIASGPPRPTIGAFLEVSPPPLLPTYSPPNSG